MSEDFYKEKAWQMVLDELRQQKDESLRSQNMLLEKISDLQTDVMYIKSRLVWISAFAAGIALAFSVLWSVGKDYIQQFILKITKI